MIVRVTGDIQVEGGKLIAQVQIEESEISEIEGRKALLISRFMSIEEGRYKFFGGVRVRGGSIYVYPYRESIDRVEEARGIRELMIERYISFTSNPHLRSVGLSFLFGEPRSLATLEVQKSFLSTGLVHLLVISGLHVGMIAGILIKIFPKKISYQASLAGIILYSLVIVPHEPPVLRATIMFSLLLLSAMSYRKTNSLAVLFFSGSLILLVYPHFAFSYSFWLSFFATLYIILFLRDASKNMVFQSVGVSLSAFGGVAPLIATISYLSPFSVLFTPLVTPIVILYSALGMICLLTAMELSPLISLFNFAGEIFVGSVRVLEIASLRVYPDLTKLEAVTLTLAGAWGMYIVNSGYKILIPLIILTYLLLRSL